MQATHTWLAAGAVIAIGMALGCGGGNGDANSVPADGTPGSAGNTQATASGTPTTGAVGGSGTETSTAPSGGSRGTETSTAPSGSGGAAGSTTGGGSNTSGGSVPVAASSGAINPTTKPDLNTPPAPVATVNLEVATTAMAQLDADPIHAEGVVGAFVDGAGTRYDPIEVSYRGAYALLGLIEEDTGRRNWKLKFTGGQLYQNRREWNFNYEPNVRQRLAYWLMRQADVKVPSARHVVLKVNGAVHGLYLEYEDPDSKTWLTDAFGDNDGDLFKAAYDFPDEPVYFATTEVLGPADTDYAMHYAKKTNNDDPTQAADYSSLRRFILDLNQTPEGDFEAFLRKSFDVDSFIGYLVVANFIAHWDSLPQRPKNYWLYQVPTTGKWEFIPWDLDLTFWPYKTTFNIIGTDASIFQQFDRFVEYGGRQPEEGTARPLVTRMMKVPAFRSQYVARYRQAISSYLAKDYLLAQVTKLTQSVTTAAQPEELDSLEEARDEMVDFINQRAQSVTSELESLP